MSAWIILQFTVKVGVPFWEMLGMNGLREAEIGQKNKHQ